MVALPQVQRVAAYAVIVRDARVLLCRLAPRVSPDELWTLPGGGLDHGEDPRLAVVREVHEETGLPAVVGSVARTYSAHFPDTVRAGRRLDAHALRIVFEATVPADAPAPQVLEVDGSTVESRWVPLVDVRTGRTPVIDFVRTALVDLGHLGGEREPRPEVHDLWARLVVEGAEAAIAFYAEVLGAEQTERFAGPDGRVQHAMLRIGRSQVAVQEAGNGDPAPGAAVPVVMAISCDDPDAIAARMTELGAEVLSPVTDHDDGERGGRVRDPWGHQWMVAKRL